MMRISARRAVICAAAVLASASCIIAVYDPGAGGSPGIDQAFNRTLAFGSGGTIALENDSGIIDIAGWEREEVEIRAEKVRSEDTSARVRVTAIRHDRKPDIRIEQDENVLRIGRGESWRDEPGDPLDYRIQVPRSVNLESVSLKKGEIWISDLFGHVVLDIREGNADIENFSGSLEVSVESGSVRAEVLDLREEDDIVIRVESGDIVLFLEEDVLTEIRAEAPQGLISGDFDFGTQGPTSEIETRLGGDEGTAAVYLRTASGSIRILKAKDAVPDRTPES